MRLGIFFFIAMALLIIVQFIPGLRDVAPILAELAPVLAVLMTIGVMIAWRCKDAEE
jgi:predicted membrane channel-forming protein YqfA (hemolysin III family)